LRAIGVEARNDRADRAARNAASLGVPLEIVHGEAPGVLTGLAQPDAVFVGGGLSDEGVFEAVWSALKPHGRLVANAVSLETESRLSNYFRRFGGELIRLEVTKADKVGTMFGWRPAMPVTQWRVRKP
jgi:precorrin-6Y C5,15-methyltransferase (decarboxylating)